MAYLTLPYLYMDIVSGCRNDDDLDLWIVRNISEHNLRYWIQTRQLDTSLFLVQNTKIVQFVFFGLFFL